MSEAKKVCGVKQFTTFRCRDGIVDPVGLSTLTFAAESLSLRRGVHGMDSIVEPILLLTKQNSNYGTSPVCVDVMPSSAAAETD